MTKGDLHSKMTESFDALDRKAPDGLWDSISGTISLSETELKVKDSYEEIERTAPNQSWNEINRQLVIDDVWSRLAAYYDRRRFIFWWSGISGLVLLIGLGSLGLYRMNNEPEDLPKSEFSSVIPPTEDENTSEESKDIAETDEGEDKLANEEISPNPVLESKADPTSKISVTTNNNSSLSIKTDNEIESTTSLKTITKSEIDYASNVRPKEQLNEVFIAEVQDEEEDVDKLENTSIVKLYFEPQMLPELQKIEKHLDNKPSRYFDLGITAIGYNSWILNNDIKTGFNRNSLIDNDLSFGYSAGIQANYYFSKHSAVQLEYNFLSVLNQNHQFYNEGRLVQKSMRLSYQKLILTYKYSFSTRLRKRPVMSVKLGAYYAFAKKEMVEINDEAIATNFNSKDYGVRLSLGREHFIKSFTVDYGVNSDIGTHNITSIAQNVPKKFNFASTLTLGAYVSLRYNF